MKKSIRMFLLVSIVYILAVTATLFITYHVLEKKGAEEYYSIVSLEQIGTDYTISDGAIVSEQVNIGASPVSNAFSGTIRISSVQEDKSLGLHRMSSAMYTISFTNLTNETVKNWQLFMNLPEGYIITHMENASFLDKANVLIVTPEKNVKLEAGEKCTVNFTMLTDIAPYPVPSMEVLFHTGKSLTESPVFIVIAFSLIAYALFVLIFTIVSLFTRQLKKREEHEREIINQSLKCFADIIESKDEYTRGHYVRVATYCKELARRMGLDEDEQLCVYYSGLLHDIGNIIVPDPILQKPGALTDTEREQIKRHVIAGEDFLKDLTAIKGITDGARYHHERYDGMGYCEGLVGNDIPLVARIINVADSFDAMCSDRSFRPKASMPYIILELRDNFGKQFDPVIAQHMLDMIDEGVAPMK